MLDKNGLLLLYRPSIFIRVSIFFFSFGNPAKGVETLERARTHMGRQPAQAGNRLTEVRRGGKDRTCAAR